MTRLKGLVWGHRRAARPIEALSAAFAEDTGIAIDWHERSLADFEHEGIAAAAARADLVIFDHPFCGDIVASGAFADLAPLRPDLFGEGAEDLYVGPSLMSYRYGGGIWGAPVDAATQHAILRPDLMAEEKVPRDWEEALELGRRLAGRGLHPGIALKSPHAFLAVAALMACAGAPMPADPADPFRLDAEALAAGLEQVEALAALAPAEALGWNSIDLHEAMVARDDIAYGPCVYGYATYGEADMRRRLGFAPFAGRGPEPWAGSIVGGAGIGVSARSDHLGEAAAFAAYAMEARRQIELIGGRHGQPARLEAWADPDLDARFNGFFSAVRPSMDSASIRPRRAGYPAFQQAAGDAVEAMLRWEMARRSCLDRLHALAEALDAGRL